nr:Hypothetical protein SC2p2_00520 [Methylocystis sp. SC2]
MKIVCSITPGGCGALDRIAAVRPLRRVRVGCAAARRDKTSSIQGFRDLLVGVVELRRRSPSISK